MVGDGSDRLTASGAVWIASESSESWCIARQDLGKWFDSVLVVERRAPGWKVDCGADRHVHVVLDVSLEFDSSLWICGERGSGLDLVWIETVEIDEEFGRRVDAVLEHPLATASEVASLVGHSEQRFNTC